MKGLVLVCGLLLAQWMSAQAVAGDVQIRLNDIRQALSANDKAELEQAIAKLATLYPKLVAAEQPLKIDLMAFQSRDDYRDYRHKISKTARSANGFYSKTQKQIVVSLNKYYKKTILHEGHHALLLRWLASPPKWLNEGVSEVFERSAMRGERLSFNRSEKKSARLINWQKSKVLPSPLTVVEWSSKQWDKKNVKPAYIASTLSWGLIYFLLSDEPGRQLLQSMISNIDDPMSVIDKSYAGGRVALEKNWQAFFLDLPDEQLL